MKTVHSFLAVVLAAVSAWAGPFDKAELRGTTDRDPVSYKANEKIVFTLALTGMEVPAGYFVSWTLRGDDGSRKSGKEALTADGLKVTASLAKPGFVFLRAQVEDASGKVVKRDCNAPGENWFGLRDVVFTGGAGVEIDKIRQGKPEPKDFDKFWAKQKARLAKVPVKAVCEEVPSPKKEVKLYAVTVDCAGGRPVTGYLSVPRFCEKGGKCGAKVLFDGYGTGTPRPPKHVWDVWGMEFRVNAHGVDLGKDKAYYDEFFKSIKSNGKGYAFDPVQNADPEKAYFNGMALRVMRALEYVKSRPEWNGKKLEVSGGSQGGLQSMWGAALDPQVTLADVMIIWCCDIGKSGEGRIKGTFEPQLTPALGYYDVVNHARRIKCKVNCSRAGLGDYTSPPSGIAAAYNNLSCPKSFKWTQGSDHGYIPPKPAVQTIQGGK
ncbi:MAG: acetylxylan esterase [Kiritimatiellae bacterium]|nr:acetylxylan esterase [Kiritimatiellia bacterium]